MLKVFFCQLLNFMQMNLRPRRIWTWTDLTYYFKSLFGKCIDSVHVVKRSVFAVQTQADSSCGAEPAVSDDDDDDECISSSEKESCITAEDTGTNVDTTSCDTDCHVATSIDESLSAVVSEKIQQFADVKTAHNTSCPTDIAMLGDTSSTRVTDRSCADTDSPTANTTVQSDSHSDVPVAAATSDCEINHSQTPSAEFSNTEYSRDMECDLESKMIVVDMLEKDAAGTSDTTPTAKSTGGGKEPNQNDDKDQSSRPNTMLSWSDPPCDVTTSKPKCAIQFENSVIFDLDVE